MSLEALPLIRVLVVDDHALFRRGLESVLSAEGDLLVVGEAADGLEAVDRCADLEPDVVVMDVRMPGASGIEAARKIREANPRTRIVMLTASEDEDDLFDSLRAGANAYLLKEVSTDEVAAAVRVVARGHSLVSPSMASKLLVEFNRLASRAEARTRTDSMSLTERELEVLRLVADGCTNRQIAHDLFIAENTVKNHVRNILEKLHLHSRMEAVVFAMREKLLDAE
ncbi:MAG TPA: response regulator transcription factor [Acidimicrobiia bacterium]|nr:response regulator transcription factor [Acidimicrobiia bacterium]